MTRRAPFTSSFVAIASVRSFTNVLCTTLRHRQVYGNVQCITKRFKIPLMRLCVLRVTWSAWSELYTLADQTCMQARSNEIARIIQKTMYNL